MQWQPSNLVINVEKGKHNQLPVAPSSSHGQKSGCVFPDICSSFLGVTDATPSTACFRCSFVCLRLPFLCSVLRLAFVCLSVLCSATPSPSQGRQSGHLMISSPSWGAPKHSLSEGKLETKSSEDSCEGCNLKPIRFEPQNFSNFAGKHS